jgi:coenzyme F420-dependent glucose-6-phosphate dehydrogenase
MSRLKIGLDASFMMTFDADYTLKYPIRAESTGFDHLWLGDHFLPWHHSFKHNFFVWEVLAAIAARTKTIKVGPDVTVPIGGRYHPAIIAQAAATMDNMFPGRFALGLGAGEAMNEERFLGSWPNWRERIERLEEGVELIKRLWTEDDYFDFDGKYFKMKMVYYHLKPKTQIPIYFSSVGKKSAFEAGVHADRLMSPGTIDRMRDVVFPSFDAGARSVGKDPRKMEKAVLIDMATGKLDAILKRLRRLSAGSGIRSMFDEKDPRKIEAAGMTLSDEEILGSMYLFQTSDEVIEVLSKYKKIGASQVIISEMSADPDKAMRIYAKVIRYFKGK